MATPKLKIDESFNRLSSMYMKSEELSEWDFHTIKNELKDDNSIGAVAVMALAYATRSNLPGAIAITEPYLQYGDASFAKLYCSFLYKLHDYQKVNKVIYALAERHESKWLTISAAATAYMFGKLSLCGDFMDRHIKLLSIEEGRENAVRHKEELLRDMASAYEASGCTAQQYELVATAVHKVLAKHDVMSGVIEISGKSGGSYTVDLDTDNAKLIAEMNRQLAEEICMDERLDDCNLIARFTPKRNLKPEVAYVYN